MKYKQTQIIDYLFRTPVKRKARAPRPPQHMKQKQITDYFQKDRQRCNCVECGIDMGEMNPRQLCGKWRCMFS
jgi:hypothetical protein